MLLLKALAVVKDVDSHRPSGPNWPSRQEGKGRHILSDRNGAGRRKNLHRFSTATLV
jgi:hypothetical protein